MPDLPASARVVGVSFIDDYPRNLLALSRYQTRAGKPTPARLRRNPQNVHDSNAIEVLAPFENGQRRAWRMIGHVPKEIAAVLAPALDAGHEQHVDLDIVVSPDHPDAPGAVVYFLVPE